MVHIPEPSFSRLKLLILTLDSTNYGVTSVSRTRWMIKSPISLFLFWALVLGFCAEAVAAQERAIRIGFPSVAFQELPLFAASKRGFFNAEGLNVELVQIAGAPAVAALLSGDVDYITHNSRIVATAVRGGGVKSIFNYVARPIYYLVTLPEIKQPKELQGRTVGVSSFGALHITSLSSYWNTMALMLQRMSLSAPLDKIP